jgi:hypothetical protein
MKLGACHVESPYIEAGQISTIFYFGYFTVIMPLVSLLENTLIDLNFLKSKRYFVTLPNSNVLQCDPFIVPIGFGFNLSLILFSAISGVLTGILFAVSVPSVPLSPDQYESILDLAFLVNITSSLLEANRLIDVYQSNPNAYIFNLHDLLDLRGQLMIVFRLLSPYSVNTDIARICSQLISLVCRINLLI